MQFNVNAQDIILPLILSTTLFIAIIDWWCLYLYSLFSCLCTDSITMDVDPPNVSQAWRLKRYGTVRECHSWWFFSQLRNTLPPRADPEVRERYDTVSECQWSWHDDIPRQIRNKLNNQLGVSLFISKNMFPKRYNRNAREDIRFE